jgi:hypothetical protein
MNCSTECPLDGTPRATLRGLLEVCRNSKDSPARMQYSTERNRLPGGSTVPVRIRLRDSTERDPGQYRITEEDRY